MVTRCLFTLVLMAATSAALLAAPSRSTGAEADVTVPPQIRALMLKMPRPSYPDAARQRRITGRGLCEIVIDPPTGVVTKVVFIESTRSKLLDDAAGTAFSRWRARPGKMSRIRVPFTFTFVP